MIKTCYNEKINSYSVVTVSKVPSLKHRLFNGAVPCDLKGSVINEVKEGIYCVVIIKSMGLYLETFDQ
jgi:hypothetical protein